MAVWRTVFQFTGGGSLGQSFSEIYYREAEDVAHALALPAPLIEARLNLLSSVYFLQKIRVSDINKARVTGVANVGRPGLATVGSNPALSGPSPPDVAIVLRLTSTAVPGQRLLWVRGSSLAHIHWEPVNAKWDVTARGLTDSGTYISQMAAASFAILVHRKASEEGYQDRKITKFATVADAHLTHVTTQQNHGFVTGDLVRFHRLNEKDLPGLNGVYTVLPTPTDRTFDVLYELPRDEDYIPGQGAVRKWQYISGAIINPSTSGFAYIGERKSRSPFTGGRGSRRSPLRGKRLSP